jgi:Ca-activated chloride channel family protein
VSDPHHAFAYPDLLWVLSGLPLLSVLGFLAWRWRRKALAKVGNALALRTLIAEQAWPRFFRSLCVSLGLPLLLVAAAGPQWGLDRDQPPAPGRDLVVVLDCSRSMLAEAPSRLERSQEALAQLADNLQQRGGHRLALVVFAGRAKVLVPLTHDYDHFREAVQELNLDLPTLDLGNGTRIGVGLREGVREALQTQDPQGQGHHDLLLVSDGDDPAGDDEWRAGAEAAREFKIPVHVVGVGSPEAPGSPIPAGDGPQRFEGDVVTTRLTEKPLQDIARLTKGTYTPAYTRPPPLAEVFRTYVEPGATREAADALPVLKQRYAWFLGPALGLLALGMLIPERWVRRERKKKGGPKP